VLSYNVADGGATINSLLAKPVRSSAHSFIDQVTKEYLPAYGKNSPSLAWTAQDSLFTFFFGINDVLNTYSINDTKLVPKIFDEYAKLVEKVRCTCFLSRTHPGGALD
jgi:hypothetical protein